MKYCLSLINKDFIENIPCHFFDELHLHSDIFSKIGGVSYDLLATLIQERKLHQNIILVWDLLPNEEQLKEQIEAFQKLNLHNITAIRFQDPGIGFFLQTHHPHMKLHYNLERCGRNLNNALQWKEFFSPQITRIVFSNEIPLNQLQQWKKILNINIEVLGIGRQEIFFSPRKLLQPHFSYQKSIIEAEIESEDRLGQWHSVIENKHGTIFFNSKDISILEQLSHFEKDIDYCRFDLYLNEHFHTLQTILTEQKSIIHLQEKWHKKHIPGFSRINKTDKQFKKLNNQFLHLQENSIGKIIEYKENTHLIMSVFTSLIIPSLITLHTPEGRIIHYKLTEIKDLLNNLIVKKIIPIGYYIIPWIKGAVPSTKILSNQISFS